MSIHLAPIAATLEHLDVHAPEVARRQRVLIAELEAAGRYTPDRQRIMRGSLERLAAAHRPAAPLVDADDLVTFHL